MDIPRPRKIVHPLIESITKEIVAESEDLFSTINIATTNTNTNNNASELAFDNSVSSEHNFATH